jgi:uncharacterized protein (UPF0332 family)
LLLPRDLIASARCLVGAAKGKPTQVALRRATSSAYYALFHHLARSSADLFLGGTGADRSKPAWRQTYRALNHGPAKNACKADTIKRFPKQLQDFANAFVQMQVNRNIADYDPHEKFAKSEVIANIDMAEQAILEFGEVETKDRRAFCALVLFTDRKDR